MSEKQIFWVIFLVLSTLADFALPLVWGLIATVPILLLSWWIVYRSGWIA